jgi:CNT family concentrative nucleoside transporter
MDARRGSRATTRCRRRETWWGWFGGLLALITLVVSPVASSTVQAQTDNTASPDQQAKSSSDDGASESSSDESSGTSDDSSGSDSESSSKPETHSLENLKQAEGRGLLYRLISLLGVAVLIGVAFVLSTNRQAIDWELVAWGVGLQIAFGLLIFYAPLVQSVFDFAGAAVSRLLEFTDAGSEFLFDYANPTDGKWARDAQNFAFSILPTIIFFSSVMTILYYLGVMQAIVRWFAVLMRKTMGISGAESLSVSANIFVGQTEAPLVVKPYVENMTRSELAVVMTGGFASVAGGVLAAYVGMLQAHFPGIAKHLLTASVMSAPAALVIAKVMYPETEEPETKGDVEMSFESKDVNTIDAAARGASEGLELALNVGAMLLAFLALIAMINYLIGWPSMQWNLGVLEQLATYYQNQGMAIPDGCTLEAVGTDQQSIRDCAAQMSSAASGGPDVWVAPVITLEKIFGYIFWPFAWVMGVPTADCFHIGRLMGEKMVINEFVAYASLAELLSSDVQLHQRSVIIATYALCGFANFGSIGIQLGGIGGIAPSRKSDLAKIALRAMIGGTLAAMMTATIAGVMV